VVTFARLRSAAPDCSTALSTAGALGDPSDSLDLSIVKLRQLEYFVMVANEGGFNRVARRLHVAQPSLSVQIKALKDEVGARLFERDKRHVHGSINMATLRYRLRNVFVRIAEQPFKSGDQEIPAGSFIIEAKAYEKLKAAIVPLGLTALALDKVPNVPMHEAALPRLAIHSTWGSTQNVGWIRYAFDRLETPTNSFSRTNPGRVVFGRNMM
jgi:hypothetical protein